ncbi:unnamed protein product [Clonostachys rhizophaga]|uniref:Protein kinase domain-containing protein n=1 Tax=Clonostachys rhizophaga TaxID=160324 RepID=A0A9N9YTG9_9HYPO|nr:unnamed protein product [Clonostachys rhizophaga]
MSPLEIRLKEEMDTEQESRSSSRCESHAASTCQSDGMLDLSSLGTESPVSVSRPAQARQRNEFQSPEITLYDPDGTEAREANATDYPGRFIPRSETAESETVLFVQDLGFKAASETKFPPTACPLINPPMTAGQICKSFRLGEDPRPHERDYKLTVAAVMKKKMEKMWKFTVADEGKYLPFDAFEAIFTPDIINSLLKEVFHEKTSEERARYLNDIVSIDTQKSRRRIAALLTFTNHFDRILQFVDEKIVDQHFPLTRRRHHKTVRLNNGVENMTLFKNWDTEEIDLLLLYQDKFFVPFFDLRPGSICSYDLGKSTRLPWLTCKMKKSTNNSRVYKVEIHPGHHNFNPVKKRPGRLFFALKEVVSADRRSYNDELLAYERIFAHVQKDNHLIKLLLTFKQEKRQYLMFEWADGNLKDFWERKSATEIVGGDSWMARQCIGLCGAIKRIHGLGSWDIEKKGTPALAAAAMNSKIYGRHGDIKPENILWFKSEEDKSGRLVLADLGLTRYHSSASKSKVPQADIRGYTGAYRAPEWDHKDEISQAYDIWSLGCVFLEFCIWFLEGYQQVDVFNAARQAEHKGRLANLDEDNFFNSVYGPEGITVQVKPCIDEVQQILSFFLSYFLKY